MKLLIKLLIIKRTAKITIPKLLLELVKIKYMKISEVSSEFQSSMKCY